MLSALSTQGAPRSVHCVSCCRYVPFNGGLGQRQLEWLRGEVRAACAAGDRIVVLRCALLLPAPCPPTAYSPPRIALSCSVTCLCSRRPRECSAVPIRPMLRLASPRLALSLKHAPALKGCTLESRPWQVATDARVRQRGGTPDSAGGGARQGNLATSQTLVHPCLSDGRPTCSSPARDRWQRCSRATCTAAGTRATAATSTTSPSARR